MDVPIRYTQYQNSVYTYPQAQTFRDLLNPTDITEFVPETAQEFMNFSQRQFSVSLVLFANSQDPRMEEFIQIIKPYVTNVNKFIIVDVGKIQSLGQKYNILGPTFMKIFKGHVVRVYTSEFSDSFAIKNFIFSTASWRSGDIR